MLTVELPWPPRELNPNAHVHWTRSAEAKQTAKAQGCYLTLEAGVKDLVYRMPDNIQASYTFHPPDKRKLDIDNFLASMKHYQDGVCAALGIDDSRIKRTVIEWGAVVKGGKVVLRLEELCQSS